MRDPDAGTHTCGRDGMARGMTSVFLQVPHEQRVAENVLTFAIRDGYPVSPGHTLVIPKRVVPTQTVQRQRLRQQHPLPARRRRATRRARHPPAPRHPAQERMERETRAMRPGFRGARGAYFL